MQERLQTWVALASSKNLTPLEQAELNEYERIEHIVIMLKAGHLSDLLGQK